MAKSRIHHEPVVVIGLGRFGGAVAESLVRLGHEVLAIDEDPQKVQSWADRLTQVVEGDATDSETLIQLGVAEFNHAVVGIGSNLEASVLAVLALEEQGVPDIWAKATSLRHGRILERTGAHHVVYPETRMGERVAHIVTGQILDYIEFDDGFALAKTGVPQEAAGKTLHESALRTKHGITVVGVKPPHMDFTYARPDTIVRKNDLLIVAGETTLVEQFAALIE